MSPRRDLLPVAGLAVGVWAMLPKVSGPALNTTSRVEFADHVVPSVLILTVSSIVFALARKGRPPATLMFASGMLIALAGLWMTATHVPLLAQAMRDEAPWDGAVFHSLPGAAVLLLGLVWTTSYWSEAAPPQVGPGNDPREDEARKEGAESLGREV